MIYRIIAPLLRRILGNAVASRKYPDYSLRLYFEAAQHLGLWVRNVLRYEEKIQNYIRTYIKSESIVFDVGANIGQFTLLFAEWTGSEGKVVACEPDEKNYAFLNFNIAINKKHNVTAINKLVASDKEMHTFYRDTLTGGRRGSMLKKYAGVNTTEPALVESVTIDWMIEKFGVPDFIKIDVEGAEVEVLRGFGKTGNVGAILIEVRESTKNEVFEYFHSRAYDCVMIDRNGMKNIASSDEVPGFANLLFTKDSGH